MTRTVRARVVGVALLVGSLGASTVRAQTAPDRAAATALFDEALSLKDAGKLEEACSKFAASARIAPSVGAGLNLADCAERHGKTATAWLLLKDAMALAARNGDVARRVFAEKRAAALEPTLTRVVIRVAQRVVPGLELLWNGKAMDPALVGEPVPVDPGALVLEARAPGYAGWTSDVTVPPDGAVHSITVPALTPLARETPASNATSDPARTWVWGLGAAGVAATAVGAVFGVLALSDAHSVNTACPNGQCRDEAARADAEGKRSDATRFATISTMGFIAGGALLASSVVVLLAGRRHGEPARTTWLAGPLGVSGRF